MVIDERNSGRKALTILRKHYLSKGKPKAISLDTELTLLRRLESGSITDCIIRTENIFNTSLGSYNRQTFVMVLKGLSLVFKPFTTVITQKKNLTFSEFKVCLRSYEETERMYYPPPPDESNNILQMKTTYKKIVAETTNFQLYVGPSLNHVVIYNFKSLFSAGIALAVGVQIYIFHPMRMTDTILPRSPLRDNIKRPH